MLKVNTRNLGNITEVILAGAPKKVIDAAEVFIEDGKLVVLDSISKTRVEERPLPGPVKVFRDTDGELMECGSNFREIPFYELAFNPVTELRTVLRLLNTFGGNKDNIRHTIMEMSKIQLLDEEMKQDDELMLDMDWGIRVYKTFCMVLPADEPPRPETEYEDDSGLSYILEGHDGLVGCVAYHHAAIIAGVNA